MTIIMIIRTKIQINRFKLNQVNVVKNHKLFDDVDVNNTIVATGIRHDNCYSVKI